MPNHSCFFVIRRNVRHKECIWLLRSCRIRTYDLIVYEFRRHGPWTVC
jgi:hypothetical protein